MDNETKRNLLRVTRNLIDNKGIEAVSMREVGRLAGLSRTAAYRHFKNKQSLLSEIVSENFNVLISVMLELENTPTQPKQFLVKVLNAYHGFAMENPEHYQLMFNTKWDPEQFPEIAAVAFSVFQKTEKYVNNALKSVGSSTLASKETTAILYAFIHGVVELNLAGHKESTKGLDNPGLLIERFVDSMFRDQNHI